MIFRFKIWQNIKSVWPIYKTEFGTLLTLALVTALIKSGQSSENWILMATSFVLSILVTYAWIKYSLSLIVKHYPENQHEKSRLPWATLHGLNDPSPNAIDSRTTLEIGAGKW